MAIRTRFVLFEASGYGWDRAEDARLWPSSAQMCPYCNRLRSRTSLIRIVLRRQPLDRPLGSLVWRVYVMHERLYDLLVRWLDGSGFVRCPLSSEVGQDVSRLVCGFMLLRANLRAGPRSVFKYCPQCGDPIYRPVGREYVFAGDLPDKPLIGLSAGELLIDQSVRKVVERAKIPKLRIREVRVLDEPRDGRGVLGSDWTCSLPPDSELRNRKA